MMEEKVKLVTLSEKQWHYRLIKFVFGNMLPDPKTLKNLCPYFWILVASLIVVIPSLPFKFLNFVAKLVAKGLLKFKDSKLRKWISSLTSFEAYDLFMYNGADEIINRPAAAKRFSDSYLLDQWAKEFGLNPADNDYYDKLKKLFEDIKDEREALAEKRRKINQREWARKEERRIRRNERDKKIRETLDKISTIFKPFARAGRSVKKQFQFNSYTKVIKATKRFVGMLITLIITCVVTLFIDIVVNAILALIAIWSWPAIMEVLIPAVVIIGILAIFALVLYGLYRLVKYAVEYYLDSATYPWYSIPFVYLSFGLFYIGKYVIYYPLYFLFISFLWKLVCVSFFWGIIKGLGQGFLKFGGIFGEYFGASYTDFCPGVSWGEDDTEK